MKKRLLLCCVIIPMAGCVSAEKLQQQALVFEQGVLADNDPISVLNTYDHNYFEGNLSCEYTNWGNVWRNQGVCGILYSRA